MWNFPFLIPRRAISKTCALEPSIMFQLLIPSPANSVGKQPVTTQSILWCVVTSRRQLVDWPARFQWENDLPKRNKRVQHSFLTILFLHILFNTDFSTLVLNTRFEEAAWMELVNRGGEKCCKHFNLFILWIELNREFELKGGFLFFLLSFSLFIYLGDAIFICTKND